MLVFVLKTGLVLFKTSQLETVAVVFLLLQHLHPLLFYSFVKAFQWGQELHIR